jgi:hypothetical protein
MDAYEEEKLGDFDDLNRRTYFEPVRRKTDEELV